MNPEPIKFPPYFKYTVILLGIILTCYALIEARTLLIPLSLSLVFALLLYPFTKRLEKMKIPRSLASGCSIVLVLLILGALIYVFSAQIGRVSGELPAIEEKLNVAIDRGQIFLEERFQIDQSQQRNYIREAMRNFFQNSSSLFRTTFSLTAGLINYLVIIPITLFFFLYYRSFLKEFIFMLMPRSKHDQLAKALYNVQQVIQSYIVGLFTVITIVAFLNSLGLYLLGINHAIFFGVLAALLTIIPYVGIFIGSLLPTIYAFITTDSLFYPIAVAVLFGFVQFLEGNFITPNIVGSKVSLNPFAAILALLVGGMMWGPAGMILFIPFLAMFKVLCDVIDPLKPFGYVLGVPEVKNEKKVYRSWYLRINRWIKN